MCLSCPWARLSPHVSADRRCISDKDNFFGDTIKETACLCEKQQSSVAHRSYIYIYIHFINYIYILCTYIYIYIPFWKRKTIFLTNLSSCATAQNSAVRSSYLLRGGTLKSRNCQLFVLRSVCRCWTNIMWLWFIGGKLRRIVSCTASTTATTTTIIATTTTTTTTTNTTTTLLPPLLLLLLMLLLLHSYFHYFYYYHTIISTTTITTTTTTFTTTTNISIVTLLIPLILSQYY